MIKKVKISSILRRVAEQNAILIDVTDQASFDRVHLPNAINIPFERIDRGICDKIDTRHPVITYSNDYFCPLGETAAKKLKKLGYKKVYCYQGGKKEWLEAGMPSESYVLQQ